MQQADNPEAKTEEGQARERERETNGWSRHAIGATKDRPATSAFIHIA